MEIFSPISPSMLADPYSVYRHLQREDPVHWHEQLHAWIVTKYDDCVRILGDPQTFINDYRKIGEEAPEDILGLQTLDSPEHTEVRHILIEAMRNLDISMWVEDCSKVADELLGTLDPERFDFVKQFNEPLALKSMCLFFGIPKFGEEAKFHEAQRRLVLSMDFGLNPGLLEPGVEARRYCTSVLAPYAINPPPTGLLAHVDFTKTGPLTGYVLNALRQMFVAGFLSSSSTLSCITRTLVERNLLNGEEPLKVTNQVYSELIRHSGAVQVDTRGCAETVTLGGKEILRGTEVLLVPAAANRDPAVFSRPDDLDFTRESNPHLGFGKGVHACIGAHLAQSLHMPVLTQLSERYRITLAEPPVQRPTGTLRGLNHMFVTARPR
ncbi:hypothetical protein SAMN05444920_13740 [Nonomuraea solani]|uniref:Cytochrome P450 n=1 Tax=Nonomuraea solani TaxID=1144553 RepID=A0A1H6F015_9ACTN|nr:cytochrome P450 [Nonomuraea solani]SEH03480.1 hypothetical protein SAMN05444920_13740 [Nonomuraea solani]